MTFISSATPADPHNPNDPRIHSRSEVVSYPLFDHPPYTLALATKMLEVFESERLTCSRPLRHSHSVSALLARSMAAPRRSLSSPLSTARTSPWSGSNRSYLPITRFSIEQSDGVTAISAISSINDQRVRHQRPIEVIPNFVNCDLYNRTADKGLAANGRPTANPSSCTSRISVP